MSERSARTYRRRQFLVNRPLQLRFVGIILAMLVVLTVVALSTIYLTLWVTMSTFGLQDDPVTVALFTTFGWSLALELLITAPFVIWAGILLTHKVAGPLLRVHVALAKMTQGDYSVNIKLRHGDALVDLADAVNELARSLRDRAR